MPYKLQSQSAQCPKSKPFAVLGPNGRPVPGGCHATKAEAQKHLAALAVNVTNSRPLGYLP
jgi:hypothetical protein